MKTEQYTKYAKPVKFKNGMIGVKVIFSFDMNLVNEIKTIPGRKYYNSEQEKYWLVPLSVDAITKLTELEFEIDDRLKEWLSKKNISIDQMEGSLKIEQINGTLFPFQAKGVEFINAKNGRALIADDMGLGKTVQAIGWLALHPDKRPTIIVVPSSLKLNWEKEAEKWFIKKPKIQILSGTKTEEKIYGELIIINYDILAYWVDKLINCKPQVLVIDEIHYIKNNKAKRTKAVKKLAKQIEHVIGLSGTPIVNRPVEALNAIRLIDESVVPDTWHFLETYCDAKHNGWGWDFSGSSNTKELHQKLCNTIMIRRKKQDVLKDLPDKIYSYVPLELDNRKRYNEAEEDFINFIKQEKGNEAAEKASNAQVLAEINGLKQLAVHGKLNQAIKWIQDTIDTGEKLIVFANHRFVIDRLMNEFHGQAVKVDGSVSGSNRNEAVEQFQNNKDVKLFIGNIRAAGVGLTLTASSNVAFLELPWTPGELGQAEDRAHRIGQKDTVNVYYLLADNTIENKIAQLIDKKRKVLDSVLDGKDTEQESLLSELITTYQQNNEEKQ